MNQALESESHVHGLVQVTRHDMSGFGGEVREFPTKSEALVWIATEPQVFHRVAYPFLDPLGSQTVNAHLEGARRDFHNERLIVEALGVRGVSPRTVDGHHGVATNYEDKFTMFFEVGNFENDPLCYIGTAWLDVTSPVTPRVVVPTFFFELKPNNFDLDALNQKIAGIDMRSMRIFQDLLRGDPNV